MTAAITVTELGKTYVVPEREAGVRAALLALVKRRTREVKAVAGVSFRIEAGEIVGRGLPFDLHVDVNGFEKNLAHALADYLSLPESERRRCSSTVRRNSVEHLSWDTLAKHLVAITGRSR